MRKVVIFTFAFVAFMPMSYAMYGSYALLNAKTGDLIDIETGVLSDNQGTLEVSLIKVHFALHKSTNYKITQRCGQTTVA